MPGALPIDLLGTVKTAGVPPRLTGTWSTVKSYPTVMVSYFCLSPAGAWIRWSPHKVLDPGSSCTAPRSVPKPAAVPTLEVAHPVLRQHPAIRWGRRGTFLAIFSEWR